MTRVHIFRNGGACAVLLAIVALCGGCGGKSEGGDTVASPPRDLVDKSFHPPAGARQPGVPPANPADASAAPAGK